MRSFAKGLATLLALVVITLTAVEPAAQGRDDSYADLAARERVVRRELDLAPQRRAQPPGEASTDLLRRVRSVVTGYEDVVRRSPRSSPADDAFWHAAVLAADAFWQFGDSRDRTTSLRLFDRLKRQYPSSPFVARIPDHVKRLSAAPATATSYSTLTAIRRESLRDALRVTLELDQEAVFQDARLSSPSRVSVDLLNAEAVDALANATLNFADDVVRQARISAGPDDGLHVVFDLTGAGRHSVYSLYNPYRIVIDFERPGPPAPPAPRAAAAAPSAAPPPAAAAPPATSVPPAARPVAAAKPSVPSAPRGGGSVSLSRQLGLGVARVVIDPGHGGQDPGAQVRGLNEAEIVLDVALRLEKLLRDEAGAEVVLTRRTNRYVALEERTAIANRANADLFISIHVNASANSTARGLETYFLNFAANSEAEAVAARENAGSARTMANLPDIVKAIALNNKIDESRRFATTVQSSLHAQVSKVDKTVRDLGVKQAPFMVLIGATMPSALVEIAFLTHEHESALLRTSNYRQRIAEALREGIVTYQASLKPTPQVAAQ